MSKVIGNNHSGVQIEKKGSGKYLLSCSIHLPQPLERVFPYFAEAANLEQLTPDLLRFKIITPQPVTMEEGTIIDYSLRLHGIPIRWRSEITVWEPPYRFVDEQRKGPYRRWHHEHTFHEQDGQTVVIDKVHYEVFGGALIHALFVKRDLMKIFQYRQEILTSVFPGNS